MKEETVMTRLRIEMEMRKEMGSIGITGHGVRNMLKCGG